MNRALFVSLVCLPAVVGAFSITPVTPLPGGTNQASAAGVSANGYQLVGNSPGANGYEAIYWNTDVFTVGLGDLPGGGFSSMASAANFDGSVIVGDGFAAAGTWGFRWSQSTGMVPMPSISGAQTLSTNSRAVSAAGTVIAGQSNSAGNGIRASKWTEMGAGQVLPDLPGANDFSDALGISLDGSTIVGWSNSLNGFEACRWTNGGVEPLGDFGGGHRAGRADHGHDRVRLRRVGLDRLDHQATHHPVATRHFGRLRGHRHQRVHEIGVLHAPDPGVHAAHGIAEQAGELADAQTLHQGVCRRLCRNCALTIAPGAGLHQRGEHRMGPAAEGVLVSACA